MGISDSKFDYKDRDHFFGFMTIEKFKQWSEEFKVKYEIINHSEIDKQLFFNEKFLLWRGIMYDKKYFNKVQKIMESLNYEYDYYFPKSKKWPMAFVSKEFIIALAPCYEVMDDYKCLWKWDDD